MARIAGDEYLFEGPGTYMPRKEVSVVATENATVVYANEALKVFSLAEFDMRIVLVLRCPILQRLNLADFFIF